MRKGIEKPLLLACLVAAVATKARAADYADFTTLSEEEKNRLVWQLHDRNQWGLPEQKPICRDILMHQGYHSANATAWTTHAIDLAERLAWDDLAPLIAKIYAAPRGIWVYERAFLYLRKKSGKLIARALTEDMETLRAAGYYQSKVTDAQVALAKQRLARQPDKEAVLVYAIKVAGWHAGKGGTNRGRKAAVDLLRVLNSQDVARRLRQLFRDCDQYICSNIEWLAEQVGVDLIDTTPSQTPRDAGPATTAPRR
jgi:hypothetical protein